jgi:hypothetical protein
MKQNEFACALTAPGFILENERRQEDGQRSSVWYGN